jgi:phospholipid/cholesterol/gamma-HCH transport system substrate-binding protein
MAVEKSYARLGLFLVVAIVVILATGLLFIQRMRSREVIELVTYTQENVAGLDISSPVRYRGVPVGRVSNLQVEPGGRTIEIDFQLFTDRLTTVGANVTNLQELARTGVLERLRAQVVGNPVTGEAYLFLDMPENPPPPMTLGFTPSRPYIPSMPTPIAELRDRLPEVLERVEATLQVLREIVARMPDSLDRADRFFTNVERIVRESELPALSADSRKFFSTTSAQIEAIASNLDGLVGDEGTLSKFADEARAAIDAADLPASGRATREAMDQASLAADDLRRSLPAIRESLGQLRELSRQLQEQPESVVHGIKQAGAKPK